MAASDTRQQRKEIRLIQSESVWLQKALFDLRKAEDARDKLADLRDEETEPYELTVAGEPMDVEALEDALEERIENLMKDVKERRRGLR